MNHFFKRVRVGFGIATVLLVAYVLVFGLYPRFFDIEWVEQVQLHDGRLIEVHIKRTYERRGERFVRYPKSPKLVSMSFSFDTGRGKNFQHTFKGGTLHFLDEKDGKWYIGYNADAGDASIELGTRLIYPHVAILNRDGSIEKPHSWVEVPAEITKANILPSTPNPQVISKFHGKYLTVTEKMTHWTAFPTGAGWGTIQRITPQPVK